MPCHPAAKILHLISLLVLLKKQWKTALNGYLREVVALCPEKLAQDLIKLSLLLFDLMHARI